ncbi:MAG: type II toxin-antitoxin system RelE/ParE family toxin [Candidatus Adiutrix sp.]|nr:type II toxin-antitoxin system RelE/ParE family toxin [Candidatus Adiutrix sp.]
MNIYDFTGLRFLCDGPGGALALVDFLYSGGYNKIMGNVIKQTEEFVEWLEGLKNRQAFLRITARVNAAEGGHFGDHKLLPDTHGLFEMRVDVGPGYRVYYGQMGRTVYLLVAGGDKKSQKADIAKAAGLWLRIKKEGQAHGKD